MKSGKEHRPQQNDEEGGIWGVDNIWWYFMGYHGKSRDVKPKTPVNPGFHEKFTGFAGREQPVDNPADKG
jgi:hypothetical protein